MNFQYAKQLQTFGKSIKFKTRTWIKSLKYLHIEEHGSIWHRPRKIDACWLPFIYRHSILKCTFIEAIRREFRQGWMHAILNLQLRANKIRYWGLFITQSTSLKYVINIKWLQMSVFNPKNVVLAIHMYTKALRIITCNLIGFTPSSTRRSNRDCASPARAAFLHIMTGPSWQWSPTRTT